MPNNSEFSPLFSQALSRNAKRIKEILELRRILEPEIAALAAQNADERDLRQLAGILAAQRDHLSLEIGQDQAAKDDQHFHLNLARAAKNEVMLEVMAIIHDILAESRGQGFQTPQRRELSLKNHAGILAAIENRDASLARELMRGHLHVVESKILAG